MNRPESAHARFGRHPHRHQADQRPVRSRGGLLISLAAIAFFATWAGGATLYILFKDDALRILIERQVAITRGYETQAAQLQTEIDRLRSLKLIDQERVDRAIAEIARRQTALETRQAALSGLAAETSRTDASAVTGTVPAVDRAPGPPPASKPAPLSDTIMISPPSDRWAQLQSRPLPPLGHALESREAETAAEVHLANLSRGLTRLETAQSSVLNQLEVEADGRRRRIRKVLDELGVDRPAAARAAHATALAAGGPFLPWAKPAADPFAKQVQRVRVASTAIKALERQISTIPVRRPTLGEAEVTSSYGVRLDPFLRQPAMHTGVDFRGETGDPVVASADGEVAQAERHGGYGLMVEIDHGNGLASRYAHLSAVMVSAGMKVKAGDLIGKIGSTGRSTGPHLHYEIRTQGDVTDPQRFLRAGLRLNEPN